MAGLTLPSYRVEDLEGHAVEAKIEDLGANFEYDLPKDKFRQAISVESTPTAMSFIRMFSALSLTST